MSPWIYVAAWLAATVLVGLAATTLMVLVSVPAFGFHVYPRLLPAAILFLSGVFFPLEGAPGWVLAVAHFFALYHIVRAFTACFSPYTSGSGFVLRDLVAIAAWGAVGLIVAVRRFRWESEPRESRPGWLRNLSART